MFPIKTLLTAACALKAHAADHARRRSSIVGSAHHNRYVMNVCNKRRDVNVSAKNTVLSALKEEQESVRYVRICLSNVLAMVSLAFALSKLYTNNADCCARRLLAIQPDFATQQCEIEEQIQLFNRSKGCY